MSNYYPENCSGSRSKLKDIIQSANLLSKISRKNSSPVKTYGQSHQGLQEFSSHNGTNVLAAEFTPMCAAELTPVDAAELTPTSPYGPSYQDLLSKPVLPLVMGRGKYLDSFTEKYSCINKRAEVHNMIHEELQKINGSGFSNQEIEERFGSSSVDESDIDKVKLTEEKLLSSPSRLCNAEVSPPCNGECDSQPPGESAAEVLNYEEGGQCIREIVNRENSQQPSTEVINQPDSPTGDQSSNNTELHDTTALNKKSKKKQRKCRNFIVLSLTGELVDQNFPVKPNVSVPHQPAPMVNSHGGTWVLENNRESIFSSSDFPSL